METEKKKERLFLSDKRVLVTGAGGGVGWGISLECAREGAEVIVADIDEAKGREVLDCLPGEGHSLCFLDVASVETVDEMLEKYGQVDVLICNAGINTDNNFLNMNIENWDKVMEVNLRGHMFLAQGVAKQMIEQGRKGSIIFTSSIHQEVIQGHPHYSVSKAGIAMLIKEMAVELAPHGIRVNGVAPGGIYIDERVENPDLANDEVTVLLGGKNGIPRDIGRMMVVLASDYWSRHVTGQVITVAGGQYLNR